MRHWWMVLTASLVVPGLAGAQQPGVAAPCARPEVPESAQEVCFTVAQAVESAQPQLGLLIAAGNPTLGTASTGGLRLGVLPRVSATARLNLVFVRLPGILAEQAGSAAQRLNEAVGLPAPALSGAVSVGVLPGFSLAPTVGGIGAVDLIGSATWLPFKTLGVEGFDRAAEDLAYGAGLRVGLLRESFTTPGISVSTLYRRLGTIRYGDVCPGTAPELVGGEADGFRVGAGICPRAAEGDAGEFAFDLTNWSTRAAIGKRVLGFGLAAGVGYDRLGSDVEFGFQARCPVTNQRSCFVRVRELELDNDRWSAFANASFTALVATFALEAGWLQGEAPIQGFPGTSDFDPGRGTFFGSAGVRVGL